MITLFLYSCIILMTRSLLDALFYDKLNEVNPVVGGIWGLVTLFSLIFCFISVFSISFMCGLALAIVHLISGSLISRGSFTKGFLVKFLAWLLIFLIFF